MIPKIIHHIWIGQQPLPQKYLQWIGTWNEKNPDYENRVWGDADVDTLRPFVGEHLYDAATNYAAKCDILRLEILRRIGGVSVDCDMLCISPIPDDLLQQDVFISLQSEGYGCCSAMGAIPNSDFFMSAVLCLDGYHLAALPDVAEFKSAYIDALRLKLYPETYTTSVDLFNPGLQHSAEGVLQLDPSLYPDSVCIHTWDKTGREELDQDA